MVFIVIAVQKGLDKIKEELEKRGYKVVDAESCNHPVDAVIFEGNSYQISYLNSNLLPEMRADRRNSPGVYRINSLGKSIDQIEDMLNTRYSSPLS